MLKNSCSLKNAKKSSLDGNTPNTCVFWTPIMDEALIDAIVHQNNLGNRVGGNFTSHAILKELKEQFPEKTIDNEKIRNRIKNIKRNFSPYLEVE